MHNCSKQIKISEFIKTNYKFKILKLLHLMKRNNCKLCYLLIFLIILHKFKDKIER